MPECFVAGPGRSRQFIGQSSGKLERNSRDPQLSTGMAAAFSAFTFANMIKKLLYLLHRGGSFTDRPQGVMISGMPRLGPSIVRRPLLEDWLGRFRSVPSSIFDCAPWIRQDDGAVGYFRHCGTNGFYCVLPAKASAEAVLSAISTALQLDGNSSRMPSSSSLSRACSARARAGLRARPGRRRHQAMLRLIDDLPEDVVAVDSLPDAHRVWSRAIWSRKERPRSAMPSGSRSTPPESGSRPRPAACRTRTPTFCGCSRPQTDGLKSSAARCARRARIVAVSRKPSKTGACVTGTSSTSSLRATLTHVAESDADLVLKLMSGSYLDDRRTAAGFEEQGLFVIHTADGYRPLRALSRSRLYDRYGRRAQAESRCRCGSSGGSWRRSIGSRSSGFGGAIARFSSTLRCSPAAPFRARNWRRCSGRARSVTWSRRACVPSVQTFVRRSRTSSASSR